MGSAQGWHSLVCHDETPSRGVESVAVKLDRTPSGDLALIFIVVGAGELCVPTAQVVPRHLPRPRRDGLWRTTCFELFAKAVDEAAYLEINFSPSGDYAAYWFDDYRGGMRDADVVGQWDQDQALRDDKYELMISPVSIDWAGKDWHLALSAVIEEADGTKSCWALRHPPGVPDFHHADCFALTLEAPDAA